MKRIAIALLILAGMAYAAPRTNDYKISHISDRVVGISCLDKADPTVVTNLDGTLIISCGK